MQQIEPKIMQSNLNLEKHNFNLRFQKEFITSSMEIVLNHHGLYKAYYKLLLSDRIGGPGSIPGTTRKKSSGSGKGSTQPREYN
jgi:hypothetical protein